MSVHEHQTFSSESMQSDIDDAAEVALKVQCKAAAARRGSTVLDAIARSEDDDTHIILGWE